MVIETYFVWQGAWGGDHSIFPFIHDILFHLHRNFWHNVHLLEASNLNHSTVLHTYGNFLKNVSRYLKKLFTNLRTVCLCVVTTSGSSFSSNSLSGMESDVSDIGCMVWCVLLILFSKSLLSLSLPD